METPFPLPAATAALALALAVFTGTALAGNGDGNNGNGNGNQPAATPAPAAQPAAPGNSASAPGQVKQSSGTQAAQPATSHSAATPHATAHTTHASSSTQHAASHVAANGSKQYGNGQNALDIAKKSYPAATINDLSGPGNSHPHKITLCHQGHLITVDVHAAAAHQAQGDTLATSATSCTAATAPAQESATQVQSTCAATVLTTSSTEVVGVAHKAGRHGKTVVISPSTHSAHFTKHGDQAVTATSTQTQVIPTGENCSAVSPAPTVVSAANTESSSLQTFSVPFGLSAVQGLPPTTASLAAGGVLGAQATVAKPKAAKPSAGGVKGAIASIGHVAGTSLPFTGLPLWGAVLVAAALLLGGGALYRRSRTPTML